jgi:RecJ-like exonuclease
MYSPKEGKSLVRTTFSYDHKPGTTINLIPSVVASSLSRTEVYSGIKNCLWCHGRGFIERHKACKRCVSRTGNCTVCKNTGMIVDVPGEKCKCMWGKDRR